MRLSPRDCERDLALPPSYRGGQLVVEYATVCFRSYEDFRPDVDGKLWTVQYIKEDGTKRFAKDSRKHGCFHVVGAPNVAAALQKIAMSPVVVIAEGYATAATLAEHGKMPTLAAYDSGNLLSVATALHQRVAIFPNFSGEQRAKGLTDFNDLASEEPHLVTRQVEQVLQGLREQRRAISQGIELTRVI